MYVILYVLLHISAGNGYIRSFLFNKTVFYAFELKVVKIVNKLKKSYICYPKKMKIWQRII